MTGDIKHSKKQTHTRHCRKTSRNYYALEAQKLGQSEAFHKRFLTLNREEIGADNLTNCCNPIAIRKNYHSTTCVNGWTTICFRKFGLLQKCYDLSILRAKKSMVMCSISLVCHVPSTSYTESQLQLYHMKNRNERTVLYFDAIRSIIQKNPNQNRIFYYSLLMKFSTGEPPIPVGEMITSDHSAGNMQNVLFKWSRDVKKVNPR